MLSIRYKFRCADMFCSFEPNLLKCLWPYVWPNISGKDLPIYSFELCILKLCIYMVKFIKLSILSYVLWSEFCVGGYFTHVVYYIIIEALFVSKRKIKKVYLSVFGRYHCKIKVKDDFLHIEAYAFFDIKYIYQIWYYSEIFSGIQTTFEHGNEKYSFFSCKFQLVFFSRVRYEIPFLE